MMSDNYIARAWVPLADAFTCTRKPGQFSYKLFRDSGKNYGTVSLQFSWAPPRGVPVSACVPLTIQVKSRADPSGQFINSFMLYDCTIPECIARAQTKTPEKEAEYLMATMPTMMSRSENFSQRLFVSFYICGLIGFSSRFGAHSIAFLRKSLFINKYQSSNSPPLHILQPFVLLYASINCPLFLKLSLPNI